MMNRMNEGLSKIPPKVMMIIAGALLLVIIAVTALVSQLPSGDGQTAQESGATGEGGSEGATGSEGSGEDGVPPIPGGDSDAGNGADGSGGDDEDPGTASVRLGQGPPEPGVIAQVGEEYIYQDDLNYMIALYPGDVDNAVEERILDTLIEQSMILQGGQELGLLTLDDSIYGSEAKDMSSRIQAVKQVEEEFKQQSVKKTGSLVMLFFFNSTEPPIGYEAAKALTFEKISAVYERVESGSITMRQASEILKNDSELGDADPSWKQNTYMSFTISSEDESVTIDPDVNQQIIALDEGELSPILIGEGNNNLTGERIEVSYLFAKMDNVSDSNLPSFNQWMIENQEKYSTSIY